jgi:hypothetical protein
MKERCSAADINPMTSKLDEQRKSRPRMSLNCSRAASTARGTTAAQRVAAAFSPAVFKGLGSAAGPAASAARLLPLLDLVADTPHTTLGEAFNAAEALLRAHYRNEYVYKNDLISRIVFGRHSPRTASALVELPMGRSCADLMVVNGTSTIYEIKTDLDQFDRLASQLRSYETRAEFVNVVVGARGLARAASLAPANIGLIHARQDGSLTVVRPAQSNIDRLEIDHLYQLLRTEEAATVLHRLNGYVLDVPRGHSWKRMRQIFAEADLRDLNPLVVEVLKSRGVEAARLTTQAGYPPSMRALAYASPLNQTRIDRTMTALTSPIVEILAT